MRSEGVAYDPIGCKPVAWARRVGDQRFRIGLVDPPGCLTKTVIRIRPKWTVRKTHGAGSGDMILVLRDVNGERGVDQRGFFDV
jgi:hypothetical protein